VQVESTWHVALIHAATESVNRCLVQVGKALRGPLHTGDGGVHDNVALAADNVGDIDPCGASLTTNVKTGGTPIAVATRRWAIGVGGERPGKHGLPHRRARIGAVFSTPVGREPEAIAVGAGGVWVANRADGTVSWVNPDAAKVVETIRVGNSPDAVTVGGGKVWVANAGDRTVSVIDPQSGKVTATLVRTASALWVTNAGDGTASVLNPTTGSVIKTVSVGSDPVGMAAVGGDVWVANRGDDTISQISGMTLAVSRTIPVGKRPSSLLSIRDALCLASAKGLGKVDPQSGAVTRISASAMPVALAVADDKIWIAAQGTAASHVGGTMRVARSKDFSEGFAETNYDARRGHERPLERPGHAPGTAARRRLGHGRHASNRLGAGRRARRGRGRCGDGANAARSLLLATRPDVGAMIRRVSGRLVGAL
jgi:YVTN family beta-propeller protein